MNERDEGRRKHFETTLESHSSSAKLWKFFSIFMGRAKGRPENYGRKV